MNISTIISDLTSARALKLWAAVGGIITIILSANILPDQYKVIAESVLAFLTAVGVYAVPNAPATPPQSVGLRVLDRGMTKG